jgi:hypothetical protein
VLALFLIPASIVAGELPPVAPGVIPELMARDGTRYTRVTVTKRDERQIAFQHADGLTTRPLWDFDEENLERILPGYRARLAAADLEAEAREHERERKRDTERRRALDADPAAAAKARKEDDVREAVIRHVLSRYDAEEIKKLTAIVIEIDGDTPAAEFLRRFAGDQLPVQKRPRWRPLVVKQTEVHCGVRDVRLISDQDAIVRASWTVADNVICYEFKVRLTPQGWEVVERTITGMS